MPGCLAAPRCSWRATRNDVTLATVAWFDTWPAFSKTRRLWGAISVEISVDMLWTSAALMRSGEWPRRRGQGWARLAGRDGGDKRWRIL